MKKRIRRSAVHLPLMMAELAFNSCDTILRRTQLILNGTCSPAEYRRMVREKVEAASISVGALVRAGRPDPAALVAPWHRRAKANARRLRKTRRLRKK